MAIKQLTVFVENKQGALVNITEALADHNVNIRALSIADTEDFGILVIESHTVISCNELLHGRARMLAGEHIRPHHWLQLRLCQCLQIISCVAVKHFCFYYQDIQRQQSSQP